MELITYFFRFLYRIKWWLIIIPLIVTLWVIYKTRNLPRTYEVSTTIYTGVMSGFNINEGSVQNINVVNNTIDNIINVITAKSTLRQVSMRLFAQHMMYGDADKDNDYIQAANFRYVLSITPPAVKALIDKHSEEETLTKLFEYADADTKNFLYGLFNWAPPYYSYSALSKISVRRLGNSDMLELSYATNDPGITFNTLQLLNEEFIRQYKSLQFSETDKVIKFFEEELAKTGERLKVSEDSLTSYNMQKRIINYDEQTSHLTAMNRDFQLQLEEILLRFSGSKILVDELEKRIGENANIIRNNSFFINKLNEISDLSTKIARIETFSKDSVIAVSNELLHYRELLKQKEVDFKEFSDSYNVLKNSKDGYPNVDLISQWLSELLKMKEAEAQLDVMKDWKSELDEGYIYYSPVGSTIKRKEREIDFIEASYLAILHSLNTARLRQKSLQMNSATLKVINPPTYPLASAPTKRKMKVITAFLASFIFVFGCLLIVEILDHTLRDRIRTERITSGKVIGAFAGGNGLKYRGFKNAANEMAAKSLGNQLLRYLKPDQGLIINLLSIENGEGKTFIANSLDAYYSSIGLKVSNLSWHNDFESSSKDFLLAKNFSDFTPPEGENVKLLEHQPLKEIAVPQVILQQAHVNILIINSKRTWRDVDKVLFSNLQEQVVTSPLFLLLNKTKREETEHFSGLLPPYTLWRRFLYRMLQMGLTSTD